MFLQKYIYMPMMHPHKLGDIKEIEKVQRANKLVINLKKMSYRQTSAPKTAYFEIQKITWRHDRSEIQC